MVELVKNTITGHMRTPIRKANDGQRYARQGRRREQQKADDQKAGGEPPVDELSLRQHPLPLRGPRSGPARRRRRSRARRGSRRAAARRAATRTPARADAESSAGTAGGTPTRRPRASSRARGTRSSRPAAIVVVTPPPRLRTETPSSSRKVDVKHEARGRTARGLGRC